MGTSTSSGCTDACGLVEASSGLVSTAVSEVHAAGEPASDVVGPSSPAGAIEVALDCSDDDLPDALAAMHAAFAEYSATGKPSSALAETVESLREERGRGVGIAVARLDGVIVGLAKHHVRPEGLLYFGRLGVAPEARGKGVAKALLVALRASASQRGLAGLTCYVRASEHANIAVYERQGMRVVDEREVVNKFGVTFQIVEMRDTGYPAA